MSPSILKLNRIAQGLLPWDQGLAWFNGLSCLEKSGVLRELACIARQSHPKADDVEPAMRMAGLRPTATPCALVRMATLAPERAFQRVISLPENEWEKAFRLLLGLLAIADQRRRHTQCADGCSHDWHHLASGEAAVTTSPAPPPSCLRSLGE
jgi:hypothetical protein